VKVVDLDKAIVTTGSETSRLAIQNPKELFICSYMNIWTRDSAGIKLLARHVGLINRISGS